MNRKYLLALLAVFILVFPIACKSMNQVTPEALDEEAIEAEVRAKMAEDIELKSFGLEVKVDGTVVTLDGHVDTQDQRTKAGQAAGDVKGVTRVINNIHVK